MKRPGDLDLYKQRPKNRGLPRTPTFVEEPSDMLAEYTGRIRWDKGPNNNPIPIQIPTMATRAYRAVKGAITGNELLNTYTGADKVLNSAEQMMMKAGIPEPQLAAVLGVTYGAFLGHWAGKKVLGAKRKAPSWLHYTPYKNEGEFIGAVIGGQLAHNLVKSY